MLIVFSGLPGTGKSTIARALLARLNVTYLRIDTIEQAIRDAGVLSGDVGRSGYCVALELARSNLRSGQTVVVDCVNPVEESRQAWADMASQVAAELLNIEVVCSDPQEHRRRVEHRQVDVPGLNPPTWQSVLSHEYEAWDQPPLRLDTARLSPDQAVEIILLNAKSCA